MFDSSVLVWIRKNIVPSFIMMVAIVVLYISYVVVNNVVPKVITSYSEERNEFKTAINGYTILDKKLNYIKMMYNASRVGLYRFHDDKHDVFRSSYYFVSVAIMVGMSVDLQSITDLNAAIYTPIFDTVLKGSSWSAYTRTLKPGPLKDLETSRGNVFEVYVPIFDLDNDLVGLLGVFWTNEVDIPNIKSRDKMSADLLKTAAEISGYFVWSGKKK